MSRRLVSVEKFVELGVNDVHVREQTTHPFFSLLVLLILDVHIKYYGN